VDPVSISAAYTGLKAAKDMLQALATAKIDVASLGKINDALAKLGQAQDAMFEMREELFAIQQSNQDLARKLSENEEWQGKLANYALVTTAGGATVFASAGDPSHFVCPSCINKREIQILQTTRNSSGRFVCPGCKEQYPVNPARDPNVNYPRLY
jgi:predicted RNA-binding Zn-ribbon protein involved in translation (DUF1610 family)